LGVYRLPFQRSAKIAALQSLFPGFYIVLPIAGDDLIDPLAQLRIVDRKTNLNTPKEVPGGPIGTRKIDLRISSIFKTIYPAVLKEPANDAAHRNTVAHPRHA